MKKQTLLFSLLFLLSSFFLSAQVVTTDPTFITQDYTGTITITFDPSLGNAGMASATSCYAHTGVNTTAGDSWLCAGTWRDGLAKYKMTKVGTKWQLVIDNMHDYYNCAAASGKTFSSLDFVFNDGPSGTKEGKATDGSDIVIPIYAAGLNVKFDAPSGNQLITSGTAVSFTAASSVSADLVLKINGTQEKTATGTSLTYSKTFSTAGDYACIVSATANSQTVYDTVYVCVPSTPTSVARPSTAVPGINYYTADATKVTLVMYAKDNANVLPSNVFVLGDFNNWSFLNSYQMHQDANNSGYWWITIDGLTPGKEYAFQYGVKIGSTITQISDAYTEKVLDPWNDKYISTDIYPGLTYPTGGDGLVSVLQTNKPEYDWSSQTLNFTKPDKNNLVIYELWIHDFSSFSSMEAVTARLDYLESLGVNAVELMPITEFDGNISWGYNPNHYMAPDKAYGTEYDYKRFIDECHKRGIAVILDMVFNHATGVNPFAKLYWNGTDNVSSNNPWFNVTAPHTDSVNQDWNHEFSGTQDYFKRVLAYWIQEYKVDGYRMDLSKGFCGPTCNNRVSIIFNYYNAVKAANANAYFILEHWTSSEEANYVNYGMMCWSNYCAAYEQTAMGWLKDGDDFSGANTKGWVSYCESHDEERCFYKAKAYGNGTVKTSETDRLARVPLNVAFNVMLQGPKMLWQFEELGYDYSILSNSTGGTGDRVDPKPVPESLGWYEDANRMGAYQKVAKTISLRTKLLPDVFTNGSISTSMGTGYYVRSATWTQGSTKIYVVGNFTVSGGTSYTGAQNVTMPSGTWYDYLNNNTAQAGGASITLQPGELKIYISTAVTAPTIPSSFTGFTSSINESNENTVSCTVYPTFAEDNVWIKSEETPQNVQLMDINGGIVLSAKNTNEINVSNLQEGLYLMVVTFEKSQSAFKIIKK